MTYEETPAKEGKLNRREISIKSAEGLGSGTLVWLLVRRHRVGLLGTWAVIMTALYVFPPLPDILLSLVGR